MSNTSGLPYTRFRPEPMSTQEAIQWLQTHSYVWYKAPMDIAPRKVWLTSKLKLWKRSSRRFAVSAECSQGFESTLRFRIDEGHLGRLLLPNALWWHGITATVGHTFHIGPYSNVISERSRGSLRKYGSWTGSEYVPAPILRAEITVHQSNGYHLPMRSLAEAISFAKHQNIRLVVQRGRRSRVLVEERAERGE